MSILIYAILYVILIYICASILLIYILPAIIRSVVWKEFVIMNQHNYVEIPLSEGQYIRPVPFTELEAYTRNFYTFPFLLRYFFMNFNLREAHYVFPRLVAYRLNRIDLELPKAPSYVTWLKKAKSMKGEDYIFRTSKQTGKYF